MVHRQRQEVAAASSFFSGPLKQTLRQVAMTMHRAAHHGILSNHFVEQQVHLEGTEYNSEPPIAKTWMSEAASRLKLWVLTK